MRVEFTLMLISLFLCLLFGVGNTSGAAEDKAVVSASEARILIIVSPIAEDIRSRGMDVGIELQTSPQLNQADYYYFWMYNAKREQTSGWVTIGYYAVNKHTA